jgi:hypothetical protein
MGFNPFSGRGALALGTLGLSELAGEETMSKVPVLGAIGGFRSNAEKQLMETQKRLAQETAAQRAHNERTRMNALGQQMLAFNPQNQAVAQMFGPEAAFSPQQMAGMANDPSARTPEEYKAAHHQAMMNGPIDPNTRQRTGGPMEGWTGDDIRRMEENERRKKMVQQNMQPLPPGAPPMQMTGPAPARRF